jgi:hypothetical protein
MRSSLVTSSSSSTVTACHGCVGSTTVASNTKPSTRWGAPRGVSRAFDQHKIKDTIVLVHSTKPHKEHHCSSTATATHQKSHPVKHFGDQVKHKTKPGASPGGGGQAGPGESQEVKVKRRQARRKRPARSKSASTAAVHSLTFAQLQAKVETVQKHHC